MPQKRNASLSGGEADINTDSEPGGSIGSEDEVQDSSESAAARNQ